MSLLFLAFTIKQTVKTRNNRSLFVPSHRLPDQPTGRCPTHRRVPDGDGVPEGHWEAAGRGCAGLLGVRWPRLPGPRHPQPSADLHQRLPNVSQTPCWYYWWWSLHPLGSMERLHFVMRWSVRCKTLERMFLFLGYSNKVFSLLVHRLPVVAPLCAWS